MRNKLDHYAILKFPLTTESSVKKIEDSNTVVFIVNVKANMHGIRQAAALRKLDSREGANWLRVTMLPAMTVMDAKTLKLCHMYSFLYQLSFITVIKK